MLEKKLSSKYHCYCVVLKFNILLVYLGGRYLNLITNRKIYIYKVNFQYNRQYKNMS